MSAREPRTIRVAEDRWASIRHMVEAIAIVAAGVWAFYTFIYQERIKPAGEAAALLPTVSIERVGRDSKREILRVIVTLRNTGKTKIDIAADAYNVWGERYGSRPSVSETTARGSRMYQNVVPRVSRELILSHSELRDAAVGGRAGFHIVIEPGAENNLNDVFVVARGAFDVIRAQTIIVPVKVPVRDKVHVRMVRRPDGSAWFEPQNPAFEDDADTQFALIP